MNDDEYDEHECDHDHEHEAREPEEPCWRFSIWDVVGVNLWVAAGIANSFANGLNRLALNCQAAGNHQRSAQEIREAEDARYRAVVEAEHRARHAAQVFAAELAALPTTEEGAP